MILFRMIKWDNTGLISTSNLTRVQKCPYFRFSFFKCQTNRFLRHNFSTDAIQTQERERINRSKRVPKGNHIFMRISWRSGKFKVGSLIKAEESIKTILLTLVVGRLDWSVGLIEANAKATTETNENSEILFDAFSCETWKMWCQRRPQPTTWHYQKSLIVTELISLNC